MPVRSGVTPTLINRAVWIRRNIGRRSCPEADLGQSGLGGDRQAASWSRSPPIPEGAYHQGPSAQQWIGKMKQLE